MVPSFASNTESIVPASHARTAPEKCAIADCFRLNPFQRWVFLDVRSLLTIAGHRLPSCQCEVANGSTFKPITASVADGNEPRRLVFAPLHSGCCQVPVRGASLLSQVSAREAGRNSCFSRCGWVFWRSTVRLSSVLISRFLVAFVIGSAGVAFSMLSPRPSWGASPLRWNFRFEQRESRPCKPKAP